MRVYETLFVAWWSLRSVAVVFFVLLGAFLSGVQQIILSPFALLYGLALRRVFGQRP